MMELDDLLTVDGMLATCRASNKKAALQEMTQRAAGLLGCRERDLFDAVMQRERLGSTGVGGGIAIPHARLPTIPRLTGVFARLERPVDFETDDGRPVDLIFMLLVPESAGADHLQALSRVARTLRDPVEAAKLRATRDADALYAILTERRG